MSDAGSPSSVNLLPLHRTVTTRPRSICPSDVVKRVYVLCPFPCSLGSLAEHVVPKITYLKSTVVVKTLEQVRTVVYERCYRPTLVRQEENRETRDLAVCLDPIYT